LHKLKELYLAQNGIQHIRGLAKNLDLEILDLNFNRLERIENVSHLMKLTDFWARQNKLSDFKDLDQLSGLPKLTLVYLEMNPWSEKPNYRSVVIRSLSHLIRLDSEMCRKQPAPQ
jgi:protein phosphatase 1 regulatory subunit 7